MSSARGCVKYVITAERLEAIEKDERCVELWTRRKAELLAGR